MFQLQKWRFPGLGGQGVAVAMKAAVGPIETIVSVAKVVVSRPGWPGCCWTYESGCGPYRKVYVFRAGGHAICFLEAFGVDI